MLPARRSAIRLPPLLLRHRGAASYSQTPWLFRPRHSSTFCPANIAELLSPSSQPSSSPRRRLSDGETLMVNGYVRSVRKQKRVAFAAIADGSTLQSVQAVLSPQLAEGSVAWPSQRSPQSKVTLLT